MRPAYATFNLAAPLFNQKKATAAKQSGIQVSSVPVSNTKDIQGYPSQERKITLPTSPWGPQGENLKRNSFI